MKIEKFTVSRGITLNMGDYQSTRHEFSVEGIVEKGEEVAEVVEKAQCFVDENLLQSVPVSVSKHQLKPFFDEDLLASAR